MTNTEQKTVDQLYKLINDLRQENNKFREDITSQVDTINIKVEQKHIPIQLETDILQVLQYSMNEAIKTVLTTYNNPLTKLVNQVIDNHSTDLRQLISDSFSQVIKTEEFKQSIISAFSHKIAKSIISNNDGLFDKVSNELKQDTNFKAKVILAVSTVVEDCLRDKK